MSKRRLFGKPVTLLSLASVTLSLFCFGWQLNRLGAHPAVVPGLITRNLQSNQHNLSTDPSASLPWNPRCCMLLRPLGDPNVLRNMTEGTKGSFVISANPLCPHTPRVCDLCASAFNSDTDDAKRKCHRKNCSNQVVRIPEPPKTSTVYPLLALLSNLSRFSRSSYWRS